MRVSLVAIEEEARKEKEDASSQTEIIGHEVERVEKELARYQSAIGQCIEPVALSEPMNHCYKRVAELRSKLEAIGAQAGTDIKITDKLVN